MDRNFIRGVERKTDANNSGGDSFSIPKRYLVKAWNHCDQPLHSIRGLYRAEQLMTILPKGIHQI